MKKIVLSIVVSLLSIVVVAQHKIPTYYDVLKTFFTKYTTEESYDNFTSFAKKKDGWYVQQINRIKKEALLSEKIFWSLADGMYRDLTNTYSTTSDSLEFETKLEPYLQDGWYNYDHIRYYGYKNWQRDMISDFGNAGNLSDTMLDGLGRAYDNMAYTYLWSQGGSYESDDSLQTPLKRTQFPSDARVEKVKLNINHGIEQFEKLNALNPSYQTLIGNGNLKLFNEYMNYYNQLFMCGRDEEAKRYMDKISLDERYIKQAKNYLNSCDKNAILFTYGDNDTYQLWYVQEKLNYRKDIVVINNSLLGLPVYPVLLRKKGLVSFSTPESYLEDVASDIAYFEEPKDKTKTVKPLSLHEFIKSIYSKKLLLSALQENGAAAAYASKKIIIPPAIATAKPVTIELKNYLFINDFLILDIIDNNILKRPIYTTNAADDYFSNYLSPSGIVYKINFSRKPGTDPDTREIKDLEKFITEKHMTVTSNYKAAQSFVSFDGDNTLVTIHMAIIQYYLAKKDTGNAKKWVELMAGKFNDLSINQPLACKVLGFLAAQTGNKVLAKKAIEWDAKNTFDAYQDPSALKGFYSRKNCVDYINRLQLSLQNINETSTVVSDIYQKLYVE
ncbi:hypothetical protein [Ferruginibacter sp. SUN106]|uniref:hypothetical protein n=1 Tax=Ferruginibacter sp. SUN106 TaxID=2978348 RepID=UPI003D35F628